MARRTIRARDDGQRRTEEGHTYLKVQEAFFCADNGMVASTYLGWINTVFEMLKGLFDWAGLKKNVRKTVGMVCNPCHAVGVWEDEAYTRE